MLINQDNHFRLSQMLDLFCYFFLSCIKFILYFVLYLTNQKLGIFIIIALQVKKQKQQTVYKKDKMRSLIKKISNPCCCQQSLLNDNKIGKQIVFEIDKPSIKITEINQIRKKYRNNEKNKHLSLGRNSNQLNCVPLFSNNGHSTKTTCKQSQGNQKKILSKLSFHCQTISKYSEWKLIDNAAKGEKQKKQLKKKINLTCMTKKYPQNSVSLMKQANFQSLNNHNNQLFIRENQLHNQQANQAFITKRHANKSSQKIKFYEQNSDLVQTKYSRQLSNSGNSHNLMKDKNQSKEKQIVNSMVEDFNRSKSIHVDRFDLIKQSNIKISQYQTVNDMNQNQIEGGEYKKQVIKNIVLLSDSFPKYHSQRNSLNLLKQRIRNHYQPRTVKHLQKNSTTKNSTKQNTNLSQSILYASILNDSTLNNQTNPNKLNGLETTKQDINSQNLCLQVSKLRQQHKFLLLQQKQLNQYRTAMDNEFQKEYSVLLEKLNSLSNLQSKRFNQLKQLREIMILNVTQTDNF